MAEDLEGSFTLSLIDNGNNVYFIKGNNPLCIYHWRDRGLYLYASTEDILKAALARMPFDFGIPEHVEINEGDMMRIASNGEVETAQFSLKNLYSYGGYGYPYSHYLDDWYTQPIRTESSYKDILKSMAQTFGYSPEDVDMLLAEGFTLQDIEDFLYEGVYC